MVILNNGRFVFVYKNYHCVNINNYYNADYEDFMIQTYDGKELKESSSAQDYKS
jgi:hypothetical protein